MTIKLFGVGILREGKNEYLILQDFSDMPKLPKLPQVTMSKIDFYVAKRFFVETGDEVLGGKDLFMTPRWMSIYSDYPCVIEWFPEAREFEVFEVDDRWSAE